MKLVSEKLKREAKLEGQTINEDTQNDRTHIQDLKTLPKMIEPDIDEAITIECAVQIANGEGKRQDIEKVHEEAHKEKWESAMRETCRGPHTEQTVLKSKLKSLEERLSELMEIIKSSRSTYRKLKQVFSLNMDALSRTKLWTAVMGAIIAVLFGVANISRNIRKNNILFLDASNFTIFLVSLVFVVPILAIKGGFDQIKDPETKQRYLRWTFRVMLGSGLFFLLVFGYVNSPREVSIFPSESESFFVLSKNVVNYLYLLANILLELSTSLYLTLIASEIYNSHLVLTDEYQTQHACESYDQLINEKEEIIRNLELTRRRLKVLESYFKELESQEQLYLRKVRIALSRRVRRI